MDREEVRVTFTNLTSIGIYPNNKINSFRVQLHAPLDLKHEDWEVSLYELSYPKSWFTVNEDSRITFRTNASVGQAPIQFSLIIPKRYYSSIREIIEELNSLFVEGFNKNSQSVDNIGFGFNPIDYCVCPNLRDILEVKDPSHYYPWTTTYFKIESGLSLWRILGFNNHDLNTEYQLPTRASGLSAITLSVPAIFVYAPDLIEYQFVADKLAPLLECLPVDFIESNEVETFRLTRQSYKKVNQGYINNIRIELRDIFGNPISFIAGEVNITLLFRKCRSMSTLGKVS